MPLAMDFGTCNTVLARWNEAAGRVDLITLGALSRGFNYKLPTDPKERLVKVVPTLIHFGQGRHRLLGEQVNSEGLVDHPGTFRWVKLDILRNNNRTRRLNDQRIKPGEAAADFIRDILTFALAGQAGLEGEELVVTVPVEAYDHYVDWLRTTVESLTQRRIHMLDEATACILGYQQTIRNDEIYLIFDFGGGTLDVSMVKVSLEAEGISKCLILGRAGEELGGALIDQWMVEEMKQKGALSDEDIRSVGTLLLRRIEEAKIALSSGEEEADITQYNDLANTMISYTFTRRKLAEMLAEHEVQKIISRTILRCLDMAEERYGVRRKQIRSVFMVGGSSLLLGMVEVVKTVLPDVPVECREPFTSIAAGACRYVGQDFNPTLVHDYCLRSWNPADKEFNLVPVIPKGTQYPTAKALAAKYIGAASNGAAELGLVIYERSEIVRPTSRFEVGEDGRMRQVRTGEDKLEQARELNPWAQRFIHPNPPCERHETKRFIAGFGVDNHKRLTISLKDIQPGNTSYIETSDGGKIPLPIKDFPLVKL